MTNPEAERPLKKYKLQIPPFSEGPVADSHILSKEDFPARPLSRRDEQRKQVVHFEKAVMKALRRYFRFYRISSEHIKDSATLSKELQKHAELLGTDVRLFLRDSCENGIGPTSAAYSAYLHSELPYINRGTETRNACAISVFKSRDARLKDYLVSAFLDLKTGDIFIASKGRGAFYVRGADSNPLKVERSTDAILRVDLDTRRGFNRKYFLPYMSDTKVDDYGSLLSHTARLAQGKSDLLVHITSSDATALAYAYPILCELGGDLVHLGGQSIAGGRVGVYGSNAEVALLGYVDRSLFKCFAGEIGEIWRAKAYSRRYFGA